MENGKSKVKYPGSESTDTAVMDKLLGKDEKKPAEKPSFADEVMKAVGLKTAEERKADAEFQLELMARRPPPDVGTQLVAISTLNDSPTNPRKRKSNIDELIASIRKIGIRNAPTVRPVENGYEIVVGHQRVAAAREVGLREIYVTISPLTDNEVLEVQAAEQIQRTDLHAMEEAEHYGRMVQGGYAAETIGDRIGKSKGYINGRIKLLSLCPAARAAFLEEEFHPSVGIPLARIYPEEVQLKALHGMLRIPTARAQIEYLQNEFSKNLKGAPFNIKDENLVEGVPACINCPHNANNMEPTIFGDYERGIERQGLCLNTPCFGVKSRAQTGLVLAKAKDAGATVLSATDARMILKPDGGLQYQSAYVKATDLIQADTRKRTWEQIFDKLDDDKRPVLTVVPDPANPGKMVKLYDRKQSMKTARDLGLKWAQSGAPTAPSMTPDEKADRKAQREKERAASIKQEAVLAVTKLTIPRLAKHFAGHAGLPEMRLVAAELFAKRKGFIDGDGEVMLSGFDIPGARDGKVPTERAVEKWIADGASQKELIGFVTVLVKYEAWIDVADEFESSFADLAASAGANLKEGVRVQQLEASLADEKKGKKK